jgi:hypothetical protein
LGFPKNTVLLEPDGGFFDGVGVEAAMVDAAGDLAAEQAGGFEDAEMFGDGGQGHSKRPSEFFDGGFAAREAGEDGAAGGVGESAKSVI